MRSLCQLAGNYVTGMSKVLEICGSQLVTIASDQTPVFFNLFAAEETPANVFVAHETLCNDPSVYPTLRNKPVKQWYCHNCIELWLRISSQTIWSVSAEPLAAIRWTLRFRGTPVEKYCFRRIRQISR